MEEYLYFFLSLWRNEQSRKQKQTFTKMSVQAKKIAIAKEWKHLESQTKINKLYMPWVRVYIHIFKIKPRV